MSSPWSSRMDGSSPASGSDHSRTQPNARDRDAIPLLWVLVYGARRRRVEPIGLAAAGVFAGARRLRPVPAPRPRRATRPRRIWTAASRTEGAA